MQHHLERKPERLLDSGAQRNAGRDSSKSRHTNPDAERKGGGDRIPSVGGTDVKLSRPLAARATVSASHAAWRPAIIVSRRDCTGERPVRMPETCTAATNAPATMSASATNDQTRREKRKLC